MSEIIIEAVPSLT